MQNIFNEKQLEKILGKLKENKYLFFTLFNCFLVSFAQWHWLSFG